MIKGFGRPDQPSSVVTEINTEIQTALKILLVDGFVPASASVKDFI